MEFDDARGHSSCASHPPESDALDEIGDLAESVEVSTKELIKALTC